MNEILNHLLQSTLFAAAVGVVNTTLRRNSPRIRYWLWLTADFGRKLNGSFRHDVDAQHDLAGGE